MEAHLTQFVTKNRSYAPVTKPPFNFLYLFLTSRSYNKKITDLTKPLIVSRPNKMDQGFKRRAPISLIPELCTLTGNIRKGYESKADLNYLFLPF